MKTSNWDKMLQELARYKREHRTCHVPANSMKHPRLGRWVALQRHKRKQGRLRDEQIQALDKLAFLWSPGDASWDQGFHQLLAFRRKHRHCDVPAHCADFPGLGSWVANQRHRHKTGKLSPERARRLEEAGLRWAIYGSRQEREPAAKAPDVPVVRRRQPPPAAPEQRLYNLGRDVYVQFGGHGALPKELADYQRRRKDLPPYIPLPVTPVRYVLATGFGRRRLVRWSGKGRLHPDIVEYVSENGCLPPVD